MESAEIAETINRDIHRQLDHFRAANNAAFTRDVPFPSRPSIMSVAVSRACLVIGRMWPLQQQYRQTQHDI